MYYELIRRTPAVLVDRTSTTAAVKCFCGMSERLVLTAADFDVAMREHNRAVERDHRLLGGWLIVNVKPDTNRLTLGCPQCGALIYMRLVDARGHDLYGRSYTRRWEQTYAAFTSDLTTYRK